MLNYAVKFGYIQANSLTKIGNFKDAYVTKSGITYYTSDEFLKFIKVAKDKAEETEELHEWNYYVFFT